MGAPTVIGPGEGEVIGDSPDRRVEILSDHDALHATWSRFGPGREGADLHIHRRHTDVFYVLEGELTVRLGVEDANVTVPAGMIARVPALVVHGFRNGSDAEVRYLNFHAPGAGFADYMRALRDGRTMTYDQHPPPDDGGRPASEASIGLPPLEADEIAISEVRGDADDVQFGYVLEGELVLATEEGERRGEAGSWVQVPRGVPHSVSGGARFLSVRALHVGGDG